MDRINADGKIHETLIFCLNLSVSIQKQKQNLHLIDIPNFVNFSSIDIYVVRLWTSQGNTYVFAEISLVTKLETKLE